MLDKDPDHRSSLYGSFVDRTGNTVFSGADVYMPVPRGCHFVRAPMRYFLRFQGGNGLHAGYLPGYPASHGCVRMPEDKAILFYNNVTVGTPVHIFGRTPTGAPVSKPAHHKSGKGLFRFLFGD